MTRSTRHPELWLGIGVAIAAVISIGFLAFLTRTDRGRAEVLAYTLSAVGGRLNGTLAVERLEGSLLSGASVYGLSLTDERGDLLLSADSAYLEYEVPTLIGGDVVITQAVLYDAELFLHRLPNDTLWNYQAVLADTTPADPDRPGRATLLKRLRLVRTQVTVRTPWEPPAELSPAERERQLEEALSGTGRLDVEAVPGGYLRKMFIAVSAANASDLVVAPDDRGGTYVRIDSAAGNVFVWRDPPLRLSDLRAQVALREGLVSVTMDLAGLGESRMRGGGTIDVSGDAPRYDLIFSGTGVALADLQWLYPPLPDDGTFGGSIVLETRPEGFYFAATDALLDTPGTRIAGSFGAVLADTLRFTEVDLRAAPLRVETVQRMLPGTTPIEGLRIGSAVIESPDPS